MLYDLLRIEDHSARLEQSSAEMADRVQELQTLVRRRQREATDIAGKLQYSSGMVHDDVSKLKSRQRVVEHDIVKGQADLKEMEFSKAGVDADLHALRTAADQYLGDLRKEQSGGVATEMVQKVCGALRDIGNVSPVPPRAVVGEELPPYAIWEKHQHSCIQTAKDKVARLHRTMISALNANEAFPDGKWASMVNELEGIVEKVVSRVVGKGLEALCRVLEGKEAREAFTIELRIGANLRLGLSPVITDLPSFIDVVVKNVLSIASLPRVSASVTRTCAKVDAKYSETLGVAVATDADVAAYVERIAAAVKKVPDNVGAFVCSVEDKYERYWTPKLASLDYVQLGMALADVEYQWTPKHSALGAVLVNAGPVRAALVDLIGAQVSKLRAEQTRRGVNTWDDEGPGSANNAEWEAFYKNVVATSAKAEPTTIKISAGASGKVVGNGTGSQPTSARGESSLVRAKSTGSAGTPRSTPRLTPRQQSTSNTSNNVQPGGTKPQTPPQRDLRSQPPTTPSPRQQPKVDLNTRPASHQGPTSSVTTGLGPTSKAERSAAERAQVRQLAWGDEPAPRAPSSSSTSPSTSAPTSQQVSPNKPPSPQARGPTSKPSPVAKSPVRGGSDSPEAHEMQRLLNIERDSLARLRQMKEAESERRKKLSEEGPTPSAVAAASEAQQREALAREQREKARQEEDERERLRTQRIMEQVEKERQTRLERETSERQQREARAKADRQQRESADKERASDHRRLVEEERKRRADADVQRIQKEREEREQLLQQRLEEIERRRRAEHQAAIHEHRVETKIATTALASPAKASPSKAQAPPVAQVPPSPPPRAQPPSPEAVAKPVAKAEPSASDAPAPVPLSASPERHVPEPQPQRVKPHTAPTSVPQPVSGDPGERSLLEEYRGYCAEYSIKPNSGLLKILPRVPGENVSEINLDLNYIGIKGIQPLLQILKRNRGLKLLNLKDNNLENTEVRALVAVLMTESGGSLTTLDLSNNPVSLAGGSALMDLVTKQPTLRRVNLKGTLIQPKVIEKIVETAAKNGQ